MVLLSPSSVASSLAIDDNLFRMAPADTEQAKAISALFNHDGKKVIIPVVRDDVWGDGLLNDLDQIKDEAALTVLNAILFDPNTFGKEAVASSLAASIDQALMQYPAEEVAVYLLSFGEGTDILEAASAESICALVSWYGSSAFAKSAELLNNTAAASFAQQQGFLCPSFAPDPAASDLWEPFTARLHNMLGREPEVYALTANDALWLMAQARQEQFGKTDIASYKSALVQVAARHFGITGRLLFNEYGDREHSAYDFWRLEMEGTEYQWRSFGQYSNIGGLDIY